MVFLKSCLAAALTWGPSGSLGAMVLNARRLPQPSDLRVLAWVTELMPSV